MFRHQLYCLLIIFLMSGHAIAKDSRSPELMLAKSYSANIDIGEYWVSEKYDGVRAYWNGKELLSRNGNIYEAPAWFLKQIPDVKLDGELWLGRGRFDELSGIVRTTPPNDVAWKSVKYMVFDLPNDDRVFDDRLKTLKELITQLNSPNIESVKQYKIDSHEVLSEKLDQVVKLGAEGLMLHRGGSLYQTTRSHDLLKLKLYADAEAVVIEHLPGKGKYKGLLGSLLVETPEKIRFRIGTGFSDEQRASPPAMGSTITYKYYGRTSKGTPRFASFLRLREKI